MKTKKPAIFTKKLPKREEAFWYDGPIAGIGKYILIATGEIRITFPDEQRFRDGQAVKEAWQRGYKDKSLKKLKFENNNWFEVVYGKVIGSTGRLSIEDCIMGDVVFTYDEGIAMLESYVKDKTYSKAKR